MATSGSVNFSVSRDDIIKAALQRIGVVAVGGTPSASQYTEGSLLLNGIVKSWTASLGMPLWGSQNLVLLPTTGVRNVNIGPSGGHVTTSYAATTTGFPAASGSSAITVTSASGIANGYYIGVEQDDGTMHWTTVNGAPSGTTVTLTAVTTAAAASGNMVYCYQTKAARPMRITYAYARHQTEFIDVPIQVVTFQEWSGYTTKGSEANYPLSVAYQPLLDNGTLRIWPQFTTGQYVVVLNAQKVLEDFDASGDTPDFPQEYYLPLVFELACILAPQYGKPVQEQQWLRREADKLLEAVAQNDYEEGSIYFQPSSFG